MHDWQDVIDTNDPEEMRDMVLIVIQDYLDIDCPLKMLTIPVYTPEWMTAMVIKAMRDRDDAFRAARRDNTENKWRIATYHRNNVEVLIFNSRKEKQLIST